MVPAQFCSLTYADMEWSEPNKNQENLYDLVAYERFDAASRLVNASNCFMRTQGRTHRNQA